jgi:hypothetical protein
LILQIDRIRKPPVFPFRRLVGKPIRRERLLAA